MRGRFRLTLVLTVLTGSVGCAYKPSALPVRQISEYDNVVVHQEVALAAEPFDRATSRAILGQSVHRKGFAPILVVLKNDGDQRAIVDSDRITLVDSEGQTREWVSTEVVLRKCRKNVPLHVVLWGGLAGLSAANYNTKMAEDWNEKAFPAPAVIEPHMSARGLLFFRNERGASVAGGRLRVPLAAQGQADYEEVSCDLQ